MVHGVTMMCLVSTCSVVAVVCPVMEICCVDIVEQCGTSLDTELLCGKCAVWPVWYTGASDGK